MQQSAATRPFRTTSASQALRIKEWKLLRRDPRLLSQTLMQILYLFPPALFLWVSYGQSAGTYVVVIPVIVMAAGQLAGGLAWLAISGEDAHDLVVTAPIHPRAVLTAKIEAVLTVIALIFAPILALLGIAFGAARRDHRRLHRAVDRLGHRHPALVPRPYAPCHVPSPPGRLAHRHHLGSPEFDHVGRHCCARRR